MEIGQIYYREVNSQWAEERLAISTIEFVVVRITPKGCWIVPEYWLGRRNEKEMEKFVLEGRGARHAYPTRELARESFIARKHKEIMYTKRQHDRAVRYLALAVTGKFGTETEALHELHVPGMLLVE